MQESGAAPSPLRVLSSPYARIIATAGVLLLVALFLSHDYLRGGSAQLLSSRFGGAGRSPASHAAHQEAVHEEERGSRYAGPADPRLRGLVRNAEGRYVVGVAAVIELGDTGDVNGIPKAASPTTGLFLGVEDILKELETVYARVYAYGHRVTDVFEEHPEKRAHWEGKIFDCRQANYMCLRNLVVAPFHEDMKAQGLRGFLVLHVDAYANPLKWRDVAPDAYVLPTQPKSSEEPMLDRVNNCWPWEYIKRDDPSAAWWRWTGWGPDGVMGDDLTGDVIANAKDRGWLPPEFPRQGEFSLWDDMKFLGVDLAAGYVAMTGLFEGRELYHDPAMHVVWRGVQHGFGGRCVALPTLGGCCNYILISDGSTHWYPWAHKWGLHDIEQREAYLDLVRRVRSYMDLLDERPAEVPLGAAPGDWEAAYPDYNDVVGRYESMGGGVSVHEGAGADDGGAVREEAVGVDDDGGAEAGEAQHGSGDADGAGSDAPEGGAEVVRI